MKNYKEFGKIGIGCSDIASLILVGCTDDDLKVDALYFHEDGIYSAYLVDEPCEIPAHYKKEFSCKKWLRIYDDDERTGEFEAEEINVYRAGDFGCIIELKNQ